ncbi:MAG: AAC(3) family N-acetyltransferase [Clostridia bacterium]|nr:AAC(3) family N-acetyltransferase [Clostridia bacterium]
MKPIIKEDIRTAFRTLGLEKGSTVMVHTSLSKIGYVCGGAQTVIEALMETVGTGGTVMMPAQSWKNLDPDDGVHWEVEEEYRQIIRDHWPAYDKRLTPTNTMGAVAEMFRLWPGTMRSDHPSRSVAAWGKHAEYLTSGHDLCNIFGDGSPIGKLYELNGDVLLIGVGYDKNTSLHLADVRADYPGKRNCTEYSAIFEDGKRIWKEYETLFVDGEDFTEIGAAFEQSRTVNRTTLGNAELRLMNQRRLVDFAVDWIHQNRH